jgi:hypothetical protein
MGQAHYCDDLDTLLDVARTFNERNLSPPLDDKEVIKTANSAWGKTSSGTNRFGKTGAWLSTAEVNLLLPRLPDALVLLTHVRANNRPNRDFMVANGLVALLPMSRVRLARARKALLDLGFLEQRRPARQHQPALYQWHPQGV